MTARRAAARVAAQGRGLRHARGLRGTRAVPRLRRRPGRHRPGDRHRRRQAGPVVAPAGGRGRPTPTAAGRRTTIAAAWQASVGTRAGRPSASPRRRSRRPERMTAMNVDDLVAIDVHTHAEVVRRRATPSLAEDLRRLRRTSRSRASGKPDPGRDRRLLPRAARWPPWCSPWTPSRHRHAARPQRGGRRGGRRQRRRADPVRQRRPVPGPRRRCGRRAAWSRSTACGASSSTPACRASSPTTGSAYPLYEAIEELGAIALFHTGQTGIGAGVPGGGGIRLKYSNPMHVDDVAADFPDLQIILAHPSFPWQDEALAVATHKPGVHIDLSGWSPKYFPPQLVQYANTLLQDKVLFGSDFPLLTPDRWLADFDEARRSSPRCARRSSRRTRPGCSGCHRLVKGRGDAQRGPGIVARTPGPHDPAPHRPRARRHETSPTPSCTSAPPGSPTRCARLGVRRGRPGRLPRPNHPSFLETLFAAGMLGAVFVPLNSRLAGPELAYQLADCGAKVLIHAPVARRAWSRPARPDGRADPHRRRP